MSGRTIRRPGLALLLAAVALAGGCGIPTRTGVTIDGPASTPGPQYGVDTVLTPPTQGHARDAAQFAEDFLAAAAGSPSDAIDRVRPFISPAARAQWKPARQINVVRRLEPHPAITGDRMINARVTLRVQQVGVLTEGGWLDPPTTHETTYTFTVAQVEGGTGLYVIDPPPVILLEVNYLSQYYEERPVYFWNGEHKLVPDLRYLPLTLPRDQRPSVIVDWLLKGPSPWLSQAVQSLPEGAKRVGNVPAAEGGRLTVNLTAAVSDSSPEQLSRLATQLRWSLRPDFTQDLDLRIDSQLKAVYSGDDYLAFNPTEQLSAQEIRFCVLNGRLYPVRPTDPLDPRLRALVQAHQATDVVKAALTRDGDGFDGAFVRHLGDGRMGLTVGTATGGGKPAFVTTGLSVGSMGRPVFLPGGGGVGLVAAGGRLYQFGRSSSTVSRIDVPDLSGITAVAVPPDGSRLALIAHGSLYVAPMVRDGRAITVGAPRALAISLRHVAGVGFSREDRLAVIGHRPDGRVALYEVTVDGALETGVLDDMGTPTVTQVTAYPHKPTSPPNHGAIMYEADGNAFEVSNTQVQLRPQEVETGASPVPADASPTAPFFVS